MEQRLPSPFIGYLLELIVLTSLWREYGLSTNVIKSMGLIAPRLIDGNNPLMMKRFATPSLAHLSDDDEILLLIPYDYCYEHVDAIIVYQAFKKIKKVETRYTAVISLKVCYFWCRNLHIVV